MVIELGADLEKKIKDSAERLGTSPETLALQTLELHFSSESKTRESRDDWERRLRSLALNCGVTLSNEALSSEGLYE